ncbi:MAG: VWA domain-containing protein [Proteobacteria bacterium]|nr:MAG: VWA domain-containing protein [Pseudomonadota bacterium]
MDPFRSSYERSEVTEPSFLSPESIGAALGLGDEDLLIEMANASHWDVATRYHEFKTKPFFKKDEKLRDHLRDISREAILDRAKAVLGQVVRPLKRQLTTLDLLPADAQSSELDLEATLEDAPWVGMNRVPFQAQDLVMEYSQPKTHAVVLCVDTSLSMTGDKLALTAVALAVVLLQFPHDPIGIVAFENQARVLKHPTETLTIDELITRFLDVPAQGYTHLEAGMKSALKLIDEVPRSGLDRPPSTVLLTDGKYTAGRDPGYLGARFPHLLVLKMGSERASRNLCRELAQKGGGTLREIENLEDLPETMYSVVKSLLRGRDFV